MKKIEEGAEIYYQSNEYQKSNSLNRFDNIFKAGVEFAQRWISVEDELPEEQGYYLVVAPHSFPKNCNVVVAEFYEDNKTFYSESSDSPIKDATHWRPIELK